MFHHVLARHSQRNLVDPDGPVLKTQITATRDSTFTLPAASVVVLQVSLPAR